MTTATANGRPQHKQLGDQLDRLDSILDGLADARTRPSPTPPATGPGPPSKKS